MEVKTNYEKQRKRKHINVTVCPSVRETLNDYCKNPAINKSGVVEVALREYFAKRNIPLIEVEDDI